MSVEEKETSVLKVGGSEFSLRILYRQNASIQGEIQWLNRGKKMFFRSLLELIMLLQEALDSTEKPDDEFMLRSWRDAN